jgi:hypothetical protein
LAAALARRWRRTGPDQHLAVLIRGELLDLDELFFEGFQMLVI